jgi:hypothetical protein
VRRSKPPLQDGCAIEVALGFERVATPTRAPPTIPARIDSSTSVMTLLRILFLARTTHISFHLAERDKKGTKEGLRTS